VSTPGTARCAISDLDRALDSLVENALRYSPPGSAVTVVAGRRAIEVLDEGPGLAEGEEEAVFERFSRGSAGRRGPAGTGLGLPISKNIIEGLGGTLAVSSRRGEGTEIRIDLPQPTPGAYE